MLFLARFEGDQRPILVEGDDPEDALELLAHSVEGVPSQLHPLPKGLLCAEVCFADPEGEEDPEDGGASNPGNATDAGVALDPMGELAEWLHETDDEPILEVLGSEPAPNAGQ